ncbi:MAG: RNA-directed DNA polymerase, partial [Petrimonas sp.]|nr:RNA-directed DNA polymerase [Petrimonas sp.]
MPPTFIDLLSNGYFPKELPPNFATSSFSKFIETHETTLDTTFKNPKKISTINCKHSFSRSKSFRRELMIPNPILQYNLSKVLSDNWITINALINRSNISTSKPIKNELSKRAFIPEIEREKFSLKRAALRSSSKFILKTDISEFYHSIYTHSIPWAIHSKDTAKANRCNQLWGNLLDNWVRNGQDGQTIGIPVGPDSSLIIAEIIMSAIDLEIESKIKGIKGLRYFDDYEFSFSDRSSAESALNVINNIVNSYELRLNPIKTSILELPQRFEESWISKLRTYKFSSSIQGQKSDIADYFDVACDYYHQFQNSNVFTYAIARLRSETIAEENWDYVQHLLSQAMTVEPSLIPISYWIMLNHTEKGYSINKDIFTQCLNNLIIRLTPLGHSNELAWCLWG